MGGENSIKSRYMINDRVNVGGKYIIKSRSMIVKIIIMK